MKKTTREETRTLLEKEIKDITRLLIFCILLAILLFINAKVTLILTFALIPIEIGVIYSKVNTIARYVHTFHSDDYEAFKSAHSIKGISRQKYYTFLKSDFYKPTEVDEIILKYHIIANKRKAILSFATFLLFAFSSVR
ncbi:hypothetical protein [Fusibacter ferrireducens]|uniref:Uncharacterized protein n=1 Tax=Fusibacter ferrireducens TaxID=2785058 RepID=A0ABR9ZNF5_9FIRM|nr:hypothetical protein [Fusibacter ferrireducens]MBF4692000.1 hypothetical protein [Fusibacter ferrireducens]